MNPSDITRVPDDEVADRNIELLLSKAYRPEEADSTFVRRVEEQLLATAATAAHARVPLSIAAAKADPQRLAQVRFRLAMVMGAAAAAVVVALVFHGFSLSPRGPIGETAGKEDPVDERGEYLTPKKRTEPAQVPDNVVAGGTISTKAGQRQRTMLPDGSVLYVNQNTVVKLDEDRRLRLDAGEVFIEVAQRSGKPFIVKTGAGDVAAVGTKFSVRADKEGKGSVVVTQGKVKVGTVEILAGQQCALDKKVLTPAPRVSAILDWTRELMIAAESPLVPDSKYTGGALIAVDPDGQEAKLALRHYKVDVYIEDGFARTVIDQSYFNQNQWRMEGTFYFPLPPDAQLSRLAMYVDGNLMEGGMEERDAAGNIYEEIVRSQKDPALLEWVDGSTFKMRVFPLESRQEKRIIIGYVQRLPALYGRAQYRFPAGHSLGLVNDWQLNVRVKNGAALGWACDSHSLTPKHEGRDLELTAHERGTKLDRDVVLDLIAPAGDMSADVVKVSRALHEDNRYMMLRYRPQLQVQQQRQQRDWVFLFESSGDRSPLLARVQIDVIRALLVNAEHSDTFAIVMAGTRVNTFRAKPVLATVENINAAVEFLESAHLIGALDLDQALAACSPFLNAGPNSHLVHVGSGTPAMGERRADVLAQRIPRGTRYVGVGVGRRWDRDFMKSAADHTGGYFTQINPDEAVTWRAFELSATLNTPRLMNVQVTSGGRKPWLAFGSTLAQGEELAAVARFGSEEPLPDTVTVTATLDDKPFEQTFSLAGPAGDGAEYLPRSWAKLEIDRLLAENSAGHRNKIIALSKAMYVMTRYTSLLVLENEEMYRRFQLDGGRQDHWAPYVTPKKITVLFEPEVGQAVDARFAPKTEKPHANQVQATIMVRVPPAIISWPGQQDFRNGGPVRTALQVYRGGFALPGGGEPDMDDQRPEPSPEPFAVDNPFPVDVLGRDQEYRRKSTMSMEQRIKFAEKRHPGADPRGVELDYGFATNGLAETRAASLQPGAPKEEPVAVPQPSKPQSDNRGNVSINTVWTLESTRRLEGEAMAGELRPKFHHLPLHGKDKADDLKKLKDTSVNWWDDSPQLALHIDDVHSLGRPNMYYRPGFSYQDRVFFDLASYAPGMTTSAADIQAVVEAEALPARESLPGQIEPKAREIIDRARSAGWKSWTVGSGDAAFKIRFDGQGRHAYERSVAFGLKEQVVCDGTTLLHLYSELGIGARRTVSRFHREQFDSLIPWLVAPADDLAHGADVRAVDNHTVVLVPRDAETARDDSGKPIPYLCLVLTFAADGSLAERQIVEVRNVAEKTVLVRETYDAAKGLVTFKSGKEKEVQRTLKVDAAEAPSLRPDTAALVVLPLPYRQAGWVYDKYGVDPGTLYNRDENWTYGYLGSDAALALFAAEFGNGNSFDARQIYNLCFSANHTKKIGFFTLLASCGQAVTTHEDFRAMTAEKPNDPLVGFLSLHGNPIYEKLQQHWGVHLGGAMGPQGSFLQRLSAFHDIYLRWQDGRVERSRADVRRAEELRALDYVKENWSAFGWALLTVLQDQAHNKRFHTDLANACKMFNDGSALSYAAQYEHGRGLANGGHRAEAADHFTKLYKGLIEKGVLPPLDHAFRSTLQGDQSDRWTALMRETAAKLKADKHRDALITLAWQCHQLGDSALSENLLADALKDPQDDAERLRLTLAALDFLTTTRQDVRADSLLQPLLDDAKFNGGAELWRIGAHISERRGQTASAIARLERALEIEYRNLPEIIDLQQLRHEYGKLLSHYEWLAGASDSMNIEPPKGLLARTIRAADRWRALDPESSKPCDAAARILKILGARDLAWDYMTTPIATRANESGPWQGLAHHLSREGDLDLADLAWRAAFAAEPTNADILWEQAQNLRRAGKLAESDRLLRKISDGTWQTRFNSLKSQARWQLEGR